MWLEHTQSDFAGRSLANSGHTAKNMIVYDWNYTNILMTLTSYHNTLLFGTHRQNIIYGLGDTI